MAIRKKNHKIILFFLAYKHRMPPLMIKERAIASGTIIKGGVMPFSVVAGGDPLAYRTLIFQ